MPTPVAGLTLRLELERVDSVRVVPLPSALPRFEVGRCDVALRRVLLDALDESVLVERVPTFGWLSVVTVRGRTALVRLSVVTVCGRTPRRGPGTQTLV